MARTRLSSFIILLTLVFTACTPNHPAGSSPATQVAANPTETISSPTTTPTPSQTASPNPTTTQTPAPTSTPTLEPTPQPTATEAATTSAQGASSNSLACASYQDPKVKITVPDGVGPYKIFCVGMSGATGVDIAAVGTDNKLATKANFASPIKVCLQGQGTLMYMDIYGGSFSSTNLKSTQEGDFTCAEVTKPGGVLITK